MVAQKTAVSAGWVVVVRSAPPTLFLVRGTPMSSEYIPDPIELGEMRCEDWAAENVRGNRFRCCCGAVCNLEQGVSLSPDPYAIPVCPKCFDQAMTEKYGADWRERMK